MLTRIKYFIFEIQLISNQWNKSLYNNNRNKCIRINLLLIIHLLNKLILHLLGHGMHIIGQELAHSRDQRQRNDYPIEYLVIEHQVNAIQSDHGDNRSERVDQGVIVVA